MANTKERRESTAKTLALRLKGKKTCNGCMKSKTVYSQTIDGVTYLFCEDCK